jgi:cyclic dehypoxanthinyl futalosine synthase
MSLRYDKLRVLNVSYLNSSPYRVLRNLDWIEYNESSPAECARALHEGEADLACIPIASFASHGDYFAFRYGIASRAEVQSVFLFSQVPLNNIQTILIDNASHTSVVLLRLILKEICKEKNNNIKFVKMNASEAVKRISGNTAAMIIGDKAFSLRKQFEFQFDLSALWYELTHKPFVFAIWAGNINCIDSNRLSELIKLFSEGVAKREIFAREWAEENNVDRAAAVSYVGDTIFYAIDHEAEAGALEFLRRGHRANFFPRPNLSFNYYDKFVSSNFDVQARDLCTRPRSIDSILQDASQGNRISISEGIRLGSDASLADLALASDVRRRAIHVKQEVSYIVDRNINYTNVCNVYCRFCAFYRAPGKKDGYVLSREEIGAKIQEMVDAGGIQVLLQGGLNPELGISYYEDLFRWIKSTYAVNIHGLSADEIWHISKVSKISLEETLRRLIDAGLNSLPGGGAEILIDKVRRRIARLKTSAEEWTEVHRIAHMLGITSTCTMMFGVNETWSDRINHLHKLRQLQDLTSGFTAFIVWPFQEENTKLKSSDTSSIEYLRVQAVARLFLDNIANIQSSWVTQGPSIGQIALFFGANDFGSVMFEENVVSAAGTTFKMNSDLIERHIIEAGFVPWRRDVHYNQVGVECKASNS